MTEISLNYVASHTVTSTTKGISDKITEEEATDHIQH